jgi:hypothetical protein
MQNEIDTGTSADFTVDLNSDRRKRQKLVPPIESQNLLQGSGKRWLGQLEETALSGSEPASELAPTTYVRLPISPKTKAASSKYLVSPRRSPRETREKTTPEQNANNSARSGAASPDITVSVAQPLAKVTPKKKVIKLNRNGKLLSSPPRVSPRSKSKGRKGEEKNNKETKSYRVVLKYGRHEEERSRIGFKIDEVLKKPGISQPACLPPNDAQPKATHPFFLGKIAQKLEPNASGGPDDSSSKGQMSEAEDKPTPLHRTVAWKDIVFKSQKPTFMKTLDAIGAPWPPNEINHVGVAVRNHHPSHPLRLRGAAASKSKEQYTEIKRDEDVMHSKSRCAWATRKYLTVFQTSQSHFGSRVNCPFVTSAFPNVSLRPDGRCWVIWTDLRCPHQIIRQSPSPVIPSSPKYGLTYLSRPPLLTRGEPTTGSLGLFNMRREQRSTFYNRPRRSCATG